MGFRRGFKSQCERRAVEIRKDLGLAATDSLSARSLAGKLGITVWSQSNIENLTTDERNVLQDTTDSSWSALTLRLGTEHLIIYKERVSLPRENSVIMHELSHIILGHELADALVTTDGSLVPSNYNQDQENEADWLAGTLLLPRPALVLAFTSGMPEHEITERYLVSKQMLDWRVRMTGIKYQLKSSNRW